MISGKKGGAGRGKSAGRPFTAQGAGNSGASFPVSRKLAARRAGRWRPAGSNALRLLIFPAQNLFMIWVMRRRGRYARTRPCAKRFAEPPRAHAMSPEWDLRSRRQAFCPHPTSSLRRAKRRGNPNSVPTVVTDVLKLLKVMDFPFFTVRRRVLKSTDSQDFQVHFSVHKSG